MRKERREEEAEILAQMEEAMRENEKSDAEEKTEKYVGPFRDKTPEQIHCRKCGTLMENGKCPNCGHTVYVPMNGQKQKTIRWIVGGVCVLAFVIIFIVTR